MIGKSKFVLRAPCRYPKTSVGKINKAALREQFGAA
jgi:hypothetical protein